MLKINFYIFYFSDLRNLVKCMDSMFQCYSLLNMKVIWLYYLVLINPYKFMSGYLYFPSDLKYKKDHM